MDFNNKILIQFGQTGKNTSSTITLPISYTGANYRLNMTEIASGATRWAYDTFNISSITKTNFTWARYDSCNNHWITIGY